MKGRGLGHVTLSSDVFRCQHCWWLWRIIHVVVFIRWL